MMGIDRLVHVLVDIGENVVGLLSVGQAFVIGDPGHIVGNQR